MAKSGSKLIWKTVEFNKGKISTDHKEAKIFLGNHHHRFWSKSCSCDRHFAQNYFLNPYQNLVDF